MISKDNGILVLAILERWFCGTVTSQTRFFHGRLSGLFDFVLTISKKGTQDRVGSCHKQILAFQTSCRQLVVLILLFVFGIVPSLAELITQRHGTGVFLTGSRIVHFFQIIICRHPCTVRLTFLNGGFIGTGLCFFQQQVRPFLGSFQLFQDLLSSTSLLLFLNFIGMRPGPFGTD